MFEFYSLLHILSCVLYGNWLTLLTRTFVTGRGSVNALPIFRYLNNHITPGITLLIDTQLILKG